MPLLSATAAAAAHICLGCEGERTLQASDWIAGDDGSTLTTPPCPTCGATETFVWHDWTYLSQRDGGAVEPDSDHPGAKQMVLIARIAQARGRKRQHHPNRDARTYAHTPKAPTPAEVRAYAKATRRT